MQKHWYWQLQDALVQEQAWRMVWEALKTIHRDRWHRDRQGRWV